MFVTQKYGKPLKQLSAQNHRNQYVPKKQNRVGTKSQSKIVLTERALRQGESGERSSSFYCKSIPPQNAFVNSILKKLFSCFVFFLRYFFFRACFLFFIGVFRLFEKAHNKTDNKQYQCYYGAEHGDIDARF